MDFTIPEDLLALKERTERFVQDEILPREADPRQGAHGPAEAFRRELVARAREAGLLAPHVGREWGGLGLDHRGKAVVFEAAGYSPLAPIAMNCFAPDEANMHLLEQVAEEPQKIEWLRPLARQSGRHGEETAPSTQMLRYLRRVEDLTTGKLRWGMLTNGARWRLYYQGARSVSEQFFELDFAAVFAIPGHDGGLFAVSEADRRHWLRVFALVFRRDAFLPTPSDPRTFHQRVIDEVELFVPSFRVGARPGQRRPLDTIMEQFQRPNLGRVLGRLPGITAVPGGVLLKYQDDIARIRGAEAARLLEEAKAAA